MDQPTRPDPRNRRASARSEREVKGALRHAGAHWNLALGQQRMGYILTSVG
jgi:hypothetical protein